MQWLEPPNTSVVFIHFSSSLILILFKFYSKHPFLGLHSYRTGSILDLQFSPYLVSNLGSGGKDKTVCSQ